MPAVGERRRQRPRGLLGAGAIMLSMKLDIFSDFWLSLLMNDNRS